MLSSPKSPQWGLVSIIAARNAHTGLVGRRLPGRRGASAEGRRSASAARHPSCPGETLSPPPSISSAPFPLRKHTDMRGRGAPRMQRERPSTN